MLLRLLGGLVRKGGEGGRTSSRSSRASSTRSERRFELALSRSMVRLRERVDLTAARCSSRMTSRLLSVSCVPVLRTARKQGGKEPTLADRALLAWYASESPNATISLLA